VTDDGKPANLLVDTHGQLWVTDFGLARVLGESDLSQSGELLGTLRLHESRTGGTGTDPRRPH
jgi:serine/threonine protein kinase